MPISVTDGEYADRNFIVLNAAMAAGRRTSNLLWRIQNFSALSYCRSQSAEFVKYNSLVGLGLSPTGESFQFDPNGCRIGSPATVWGTKAKPSVSPKPRRLCCLLFPQHRVD